jgi:hypothetical protein
MVSKETLAPNELPMCEAPIFPSPLIHPGSWKVNSQKFAPGFIGWHHDDVRE